MSVYRPSPGESASAIDVVLVTYNSSKHIDAAISSLADQETVDLTLYIQDNGSADNSYQLAVDAVARHNLQSRIETDRTNPGFSRAVNRLVAMGESRYVLILNPDTRALPHTKSSALKQLASVASGDFAGFVSPRLSSQDGRLDAACLRREPTLRRSLVTLVSKRARVPQWLLQFGYNAPDPGVTSTVAVDAINGAFMLIERFKLDRLGPLDEQFWMYAEDLDWCRRARNLGYQNLFDGTQDWGHEKAGSEDGQRGPRTERAMKESMVRYFNKYHRQPWQLPLRGLVSLTARVLLK